MQTKWMVSACLAFWAWGCGGAQHGMRAPYDQMVASSVEVLLDGELELSGVAVTEDRVISASHGLPKAGERIEVRLQDGRVFPAEVVGVAYGDDLMLLQVDLPEDVALNPARWTAQMPPAGSEIYLYGSPAYRHGLMFRGLLARERVGYEFFEKEQNYYRVHYLDAHSPHGTSGGAWFDSEGRVCGIQMGMMRDAGIAYATGLEHLQKMLDGETVCTPDVGMILHENWFFSDDEIDVRPANGGLRVGSLFDFGPAQRAGLQVGDWLVALNDEPVSEIHQFFDRMYALKQGEKVELTVLRSSPKRLLIVDLPWRCREEGSPEQQSLKEVLDSVSGWIEEAKLESELQRVQEDSDELSPWKEEAKARCEAEDEDSEDREQERNEEDESADAQNSSEDDGALSNDGNARHDGGFRANFGAREAVNEGCDA